MQSSHSLDRLSVAFSDSRAVADAGLVLPATLTEKLGLRELYDQAVDLGESPGRGHVGVKALTLIYSALSGDCIDDAGILRAGRTQAVLGCEVRAPSTLEIGADSCVRPAFLCEPPLLASSVCNHCVVGARNCSGAITIPATTHFCTILAYIGYVLVF